ncbi:hypothetical protein O181_089907 [Austropuccinia psidii MF-1]|uniref:ATP-dependent DNA helicase n=1 Tax=Austropuccinia psidii MF-1 TaxID=1389203 RepID=A0A9Q3P765_9BASI|nr:hypothetical protein [Austropuccinia psidii MF-1]
MTQFPYPVPIGIPDFLAENLSSRSLVPMDLPTEKTGKTGIGRHPDIVLPFIRIQKECNTKSLTEEQKKIFDNFKTSILSLSQYLGFLDGPGGSGKTYLLNCILLECNKLGLKVAAVCASGMALVLLFNGTTAHSTFGFPLNVHENSNCNWLPNDQRSANMKNIDVIIWDKVSMQHQYAIEAVDWSLKDLKRSDALFGGASVLFSGEFRQILPIVNHGSIYDQVMVCLKKSYVLNLLARESLTKNLRLGLSNNDNTENTDLFAAWLYKLWEGKLQSSEIAKVPVTPIRSKFSENILTLRQDVVKFVYGDLNNILCGGTTQAIIEYFKGCGIITPLNSSVHDINSLLLNQVQLPSHISRSIDLILEDSANEVPEEILKSIQPPGFPRNLIELKHMTTVILLRNLNVGKGLCNGTRLLVHEVRGHMLVYTVITGWRKGTTVFLLKIKLHYEENEDYGVCFSGYQFPVALAYATTINTAQGQSFDYVGVYLNTDVFCDGQLYVALSRSRFKKNFLLCAYGQTKCVTNVVVKTISH